MSNQNETNQNETKESKEVVIKNEIIGYVRQLFDSKMRYCEKKIADFKEAFEKDPNHALTWSDHMFEVAPLHSFLKFYEDWVKSDEFDPWSFQKELRNRVNNNLLYGGSKSTSQATNMIKEGEMYSLAPLENDVEKIIKSVTDRHERAAEQAQQLAEESERQASTRKRKV